MVPSAMTGKKSISVTVVDTEFDLAWAFYCTVFGVQNLKLYASGANQYVTFATYPLSSSECYHFHLDILWRNDNDTESGSAPSTPAKFKKFVKPSKDTAAVQKSSTVITKRRPAAISNLMQGTARHVAYASMESKFSLS